MRFSPNPLHLLFGLIIWAIWFVIMYSLLSIGCSIYPVSSYPLNWITLLLFCCMLITLSILLYLMYICWQTKSHSNKNSALTAFILWVSLGGYLAAVIATFSIGIMVLFFPPCL